jgi:L-fuculose-phosphate aldolase
LDHLDLRTQIVETCRRMSDTGLMAGTEGNVSVRTPEGDVLITPSGLDYAVMEPEDVVPVSLDGETLGGAFEPSVETPVHTGIYRSRAETGAVVHTHARFSTTLACLDREIPPVHYMLAVLSDEGRAPVVRYATYGTEDLAENVTRALGDAHRACLLRNHGTIAGGSTEFNARATFHLATAHVRWRIDRRDRTSWRLLPTWSSPTAYLRRFPNCATPGVRVEGSRAAHKLPNRGHDRFGGAR